MSTLRSIVEKGFVRAKPLAEAEQPSLLMPPRAKESAGTASLPAWNARAQPQARASPQASDERSTPALLRAKVRRRK